MSTSIVEPAKSVRPAALKVSTTVDALVVDLRDGRTIQCPLEWFPRLARGKGIHWPDLDEDISVAALVAGHPSAESSESQGAWLAARDDGKRPRRARSNRGARR